MSALRASVGRLMIVGVSGSELTPIERAWLKLIKPAGVILFRRNIETSAQTRALLDEIGALIGAYMFRCVDVEGGLVDRLRDCVAAMPSAAAVAASGRPALYRKHGALIGREVRALGFNTTFAPVLDLALPASQAVLQTRAASSDPAHVVAYADAFLDGLASQKVLGCGKHFPGLGGGNLDSHLATPSIERTWDEIWDEDLLPYRALAKKLPMVMVSHAAYPAAGGSSLPASVSSEWIEKVLKRRIKFRGLVLSDDLEMGGILSHTSIENAAIDAIDAGTHLIEICKDPALIFRAYEGLLSEAERSPGFRRAVESAARKVVSARRSLPVDRRPGRFPTAAIMERLRADIQAFAEQVPEPGTKEVQP